LRSHPEGHRLGKKSGRKLEEKGSKERLLERGGSFIGMGRIGKARKGVF